MSLKVTIQAGMTRYFLMLKKHSTTCTISLPSAKKAREFFAGSSCFLQRHSTEAQFVTGIFPIFACQIFGAVSCTELPVTSTATLTGMSSTTNS